MRRFLVHSRRRRSDKHLKSGKGYWRVDFEQAWQAYCPGDTPAQDDKGRLDRPPARAVTVFLAHLDLLSVQAS